MSTRLRRRLAGGATDYAGVDQGNATRIVAAICSLNAVIAVLFLPLYPPTDPLGAVGWVIAGALIAGGFAAGRVLRRLGHPASFELLLAVSTVGLLAMGVLEWLGGGAEAAYSQIALLWLGSVVGIHPVQRVLPYFGLVAVVAAAPLIYNGWDERIAEDILAEFVLWSALGIVIFGLMTYVRGQRLELREQEAEAQQMARADDLTGLGNRRAFDEVLDAELARSRRAGSTTSIALIDLDRFKEINDRFGHLDGDRCLREAAGAISRALRAGDRAFRWGGDEFALVLPDTDLDGAEQAAARIAAEVLNTCAAADGTPLSISWGTAEAAEGIGAKELLGRADLALLALKREKLRT